MWTSGVRALSNVLSPGDLAALRADCTRLRADIDDAELCDRDCVLEADDGLSASRHDLDAYLRARGTAPEARDAFKALLLHRLPAVVAETLGLAATCDLRLFNEHFVVKPAREAPAFRWHTDAAHQLEAVLALSASPASHQLSEYASAWVALDDVDAANGQLLLLPWDAPQPPGARPLEPADSSQDNAAAPAGSSGRAPGGCGASQGSRSSWPLEASTSSSAIHADAYSATPPPSASTASSWCAASVCHAKRPAPGGFTTKCSLKR